MARLLAIGCVGVASVAVLIQLPLTIRKRDHRAHELASLTYEDRDFAAGNSIVPSQRLVFEARALIPPNGAYQIVEGAQPIAEATDLTLRFSPSFLTSFLMPRRPLPGASWVICIGCDASGLGPRVHVVWTDGQGSSLLRVPS